MYILSSYIIPQYDNHIELRAQSFGSLWQSKSIDIRTSTCRSKMEHNVFTYRGMVANQRVLILHLLVRNYSEMKNIFFFHDTAFKKCPLQNSDHFVLCSICERQCLYPTGGLVVIVMRKEYLDIVADYRGRLERYMMSLEHSRSWRRLEAVQVPHYAFGKDGMVYVFQVNVSGGCNASLE